MAARQVGSKWRHYGGYVGYRVSEEREPAPNRAVGSVAKASDAPSRTVVGKWRSHRPGYVWIKKHVSKETLVLRNQGEQKDATKEHVTCA